MVFRSRDFFKKDGSGTCFQIVFLAFNFVLDVILLRLRRLLCCGFIIRQMENMGRSALRN